MAIFVGDTTVAYGNWKRQVAFRELATAASMQREPFVQRIEMTKAPFMIGYVAVLLATGLTVAMPLHATACHCMPLHATHATACHRRLASLVRRNLQTQ